MTYRPPPPSSMTYPQQQPGRQGSLRRTPSAKEVASSGSFVSPLTRLEAEGRSARSRANSTSASNASNSGSGSTSFPIPNYNRPSTVPHQPQPQSQAQPAAPPIPTLEFGNLFRNSRYSVDSLSSVESRLSTDSFASYGTISQTEEPDDGYESPSTPKASTSKQGQQSYFEQQQRNQQSRTPSPSKGQRAEEGGLQMRDFSNTKHRIPSSNSNSTLNSSTSNSTAKNGSLTPKRSFSVTSRRIPSENKPLPPNPQQQQVFNLGPIPQPKSRNRDRSGSDALAKEIQGIHRPKETEVTADWASVHGEQGSDWGDDESQFEWVDTEGAPGAVNGIEGQEGGGSPSKRLSRFKAAVTSVGTDGQKKLKKPLIIHRRAPPPPPNTAPAPAPAVSLSEPTSPIRRYAANGPTPATISHPTMMMPTPRPHHSEIPKRAGTIRSASSNSNKFPTSRNRIISDEPHQPTHHQHHLSNSEPDIFHPPQPPFGGVKRPSPLMVPMKMDDGPSSPMDNESRHSHMSFLSVAYSFYDLDGDHSPSNTPKPTDPFGNTNTTVNEDLVFPHGKYVKVSASTLERQRQSERERTISESTVGSNDAGKTPEDFVHLGIEARGKGDMAKSAWYFMRAAEGGSATGRMYWGLALRHGWGVHRDDKKAFIELKQACEETLAEGGLDFHKSPGHVKLTAQQKKLMQKELALGMFEVGNCFLEGIGVKKSPDVAMAYLKFAAGMGDVASQEQLGFLLSKGSNGIKKDMREAARWYRMAIANGSSNTFGLAWIWKDKYMN
ncbi:hypothetical protein I302_103964 [Kwoniella bestiolae CBS 10118]|uniref:Uncharacterized protein n=1 Tax=Kwoniella bestiolae CBS 10118 TaxID=1296100 RepID=A0A1B9G9Y8_9TREE|nr:hypothetical protein I302_02670 [Kwoniella bestiolae CBS 10118]OCF27821.1 hypothetical protein I302_02670 [Kwoniella bestiolae CBS 10118]